MRRQYVLFYDGECGLCRWIVDVIQWWGPLRPIKYVNVFSRVAMLRYPQIDREVGRRYVILLAPDGEQHLGYDAVTEIVALMPGVRRLHWLLRLWPMRVLGNLMYEIVTRNRHGISRAMGLEAAVG